MRKLTKRDLLDPSYHLVFSTCTKIFDEALLSKEILNPKEIIKDCSVALIEIYEAIQNRK